MSKPMKIAIIVVGLAGAIGLIAWQMLSGDRGTPLADRVAVVDVLTGDAMWVKRTDVRLLTVPGKGEGGEFSLYPIQNVDGSWVISERYRSGLLAQFPDKSRLKVDVTTFESPESP